ncbi:MAG: phosphatase PAP2 family protein [Acidobacteriota bacterium]
MATVFAHQYSNRPLIRYGSYTWATLVSLSRLTGKNHYPSDVLVRSTIGYLIGRFVARQHGRPPRKP